MKNNNDKIQGTTTADKIEKSLKRQQNAFVNISNINKIKSKASSVAALEKSKKIYTDEDFFLKNTYLKLYDNSYWKEKYFQFSFFIMVNHNKAF